MISICFAGVQVLAFVLFGLAILLLSRQRFTFMEQMMELPTIWLTLFYSFELRTQQLTKMEALRKSKQESEAHRLVLNSHVWFMPPWGSTSHPNGLETEDLGITSQFRSRNQIRLFWPLTCIDLHIRLWVWSLSTTWKGVRHLRSPGLWAILYFMLIGHI